MYQRALVVFMLISNICFSGFTQSHLKNVDVQLGEKMKGYKDGNLEDIIGFDQSGYYVLRWTNSRDRMLEHYDYQLKQVKTEKLDLGKGRKQRKFEFFLYIDEHIYLFSSFNDPKSKQNVLYAQQIDKSTLKPDQNLKKVAAMDYFDYSKKSDPGVYGYQLGVDSSHILISYLLPYPKRGPEKFGFSMLDKQLNLKWQKVISMPYGDEVFTIKQQLVDKKGNLYILGKMDQERPRGGSKDLPTYDYRIAAYTNQGSEFKEYTIHLNQYFIANIKLVAKDNGELITSGFYAEKTEHAIKGIFLHTWGSGTTKALSEILQPFEKDFLGELSDNSQTPYTLDKFIIHPDGSIAMVAEQFYISTVSKYNTADSEAFYYLDVMVVNISPNGTIRWAKRIPKKQITLRDQGFYSSYVFVEEKGNMYFIFNDHPKNLKPGATKTYNLDGSTGSFMFPAHNTGIGNNLTAVMVTINDQGEIQKQALFNTKESGVMTRPKGCQQVAKNEIILFGQQKNAHRFAKVTLK